MAVLNFESQTFKGPPVLLDVLLPSVGCQKAVVCKVLQNSAPKKFFLSRFSHRLDSLSVSLFKVQLFCTFVFSSCTSPSAPAIKLTTFRLKSDLVAKLYLIIIFLFSASNYHFSFLLRRAAKCCPLGFTSSFTALSFNQIRSFLNLELSSGPHLSTKLYLGNKSTVILVTMQKKLSPGPFLDLGLKAFN